MGWSCLKDRESGNVITNEAGEPLYEGDMPVERSYYYQACVDLHFRKAFNREPTKDEWAHFLKFRTHDERLKLIVFDDPRFLPVWLIIHGAHAYEDGLWWGKFERALDCLEWERMYHPPKNPWNLWIERAMEIAGKSHEEILALPIDILIKLRTLDRIRFLSGLDAKLEHGPVELPTKEVLDRETGEVETYVGFPAPTPEAESEFQNLVLEIFAL